MPKLGHGQRRTERPSLILSALCSLAALQPAVAQAQQDNASAKEPDTPPPDTGPIIPDDEFDAAIPQIDADSPPPAELAPVAEANAPGAQGVESAPGAQGAESAPGAQGAESAPGAQGAESAPGAQGAESAPGAQGGELAPALPDDPELDKPLEPLASFDVEPFDEARYTEAADDEDSEVAFDYRVEGLEGVDDQSAVAPINGNEIRNRFEDLSALEDSDGKAANGAMINARLDEDQQLLLDILSGQGYFDAQIHSSLQLPTQGSTDRITAILQATPGPRYKLGTITFDAPPVTPPDLISSAFVPRSGEPIVADRILAAEGAIAVALPEHGYPFVKIGQRDILLDPQTRTGDYTLPVTPGPRSSYGDIVSKGDSLFAPEHIAQIARFRKGELYDSRMVDDLRKALVATGLFSVVSVDPEPSGEPAGDGTDYATLVVNQEAGPPRTLAAQAGYATGQGIKVEGSWTHRNFFPPEGALSLEAVAGTQEQSLGATFRRSNAGRRDRSVTVGIDAQHVDYDAFEAYTGRLAGRIAYESTPIWQKRFSYNYGFELLASNEQDYDFALGERRARTYYVFALPGQVTFDTSNSLLDPTRGYRLTAQLSPEVSLGSGAQTYAKAIFEATGYYPVSDGLVLAGRARVGMIGGAARAQIAPSRRFYAGGGGSVRGFGYQELGPKDPDARPIGGRSLVETAVEARYRFGNYGVAAFVDAGQVYTSELPRFTDWRFGVGIGARFYTNFGPMRLDIATPIDRKPGESRIAVYVSIGQAF